MLPLIPVAFSALEFANARAPLLFTLLEHRTRYGVGRSKPVKVAAVSNNVFQKNLKQGNDGGPLAFYRSCNIFLLDA